MGFGAPDKGSRSAEGPLEEMRLMPVLILPKSQSTLVHETTIPIAQGPLMPKSNTGKRHAIG